MIIISPDNPFLFYEPRCFVQRYCGFGRREDDAGRGKLQTEAEAEPLHWHPCFTQRNFSLWIIQQWKDLHCKTVAQEYKWLEISVQYLLQNGLPRNFQMLSKVSLTLLNMLVMSFGIFSTLVVFFSRWGCSSQDQSVSSSSQSKAKTIKSSSNLYWVDFSLKNVHNKICLSMIPCP